jgi:hypothetical protein
MNVGGIASMATDMHMFGLRTEASTRVMGIANDVTEQQGADLVRMLNEVSEQTGVGSNFDVSA